MEIAAKQKASVRQVLDDVYDFLSWSYLAQNYFGKSRTWIYHKFSGKGYAAGVDNFSDIDREKLRDSLNDIALRIQNAAAKL